MGVVVLFFIFTVYEAAYMKVIVLPLTEYHSEIAKKRKEKNAASLLPFWIFLSKYNILLLLLFFS